MSSCVNTCCETVWIRVDAAVVRLRRTTRMNQQKTYVVQMTFLLGVPWCCQWFRLLCIFLPSLQSFSSSCYYCALLTTAYVRGGSVEGLRQMRLIFSLYLRFESKSLVVVTFADCVLLTQLQGCNKEFISDCFLSFPSFPSSFHFRSIPLIQLIQVWRKAVSCPSTARGGTLA